MNTHITRPSEAEVERRIELAMDRLDHELLSGKLTQEQYEARVRNLSAYAWPHAPRT